MDLWADFPRNEDLAGLAAYRTGSGPDLVLIHGVGLRSEAWGAMIGPLSQNFRVWAIDMPGHGESAVQTLVSMDDFAVTFEKAVDAIGAPVAVAGHSMGAMIALQLAGRQKISLSHVAALNAIYRRTPAASHAVRARARALAVEPNPDPKPTLERWFGSKPEGAKKSASDACKRWLESCPSEGYLRAYTVFAEHDGPSDDILSAIDVPALFLTGENEPNSTPAMSASMSAKVMHGQTAIIRDAAHMAPMTHGSEISDRLIAFFKSDSGDT